MKKNTFIFTVGISIVLTTRVYSSTVLAETFTTESDTYTVQNEDMTKFELLQGPHSFHQSAIYPKVNHKPY